MTRPRTASVLPHAVMRRRRADLIREAGSAGTITDVFSTAAQRLRALIPYDASAWLMTDPATGLPGAPSMLEDFDASMDACTEHWHRELVQPDINRFPEIARAAIPAAALRASVGDPHRSARFRWFVQPLGFGDELRAVLRAGGTPWAMVTLWRREDRPAFGRHDVGLMGSLSEPLADVVRRHVRDEYPAAAAAPADAPGVLTFDATGQLTSANARAAAWLEELPHQELVPTAHGLQVPVWVLATASRSRSSLSVGDDGTARTRVRTRRGRWLVGAASTTQDASGAAAGTVVVLEPASRAMMAPVVVRAYGLTTREQEITRQIARGADTAVIARTLFLSPHTVRDHVKSILGKVGVASRGELVATLYAEQFEPVHLGEITAATAS